VADAASRHGARTGVPTAEPAQRWAGDPEGEGQLIWLIAEAHGYTRNAINQAVRRHGVTPPQLGILHRLADQPGLSGAELARQMFVSPQAAHLALTTLEDKGLIDRQSDPGAGHLVRSALTPRGEQMIERCRSELREVAAEISAVLDAPEQRALTDLLRRYVEGSRERVRPT
jgi:DNA-binding MarR family transcriptional regulator